MVEVLEAGRRHEAAAIAAGQCDQDGIFIRPQPARHRYDVDLEDVPASHALRLIQEHREGKDAPEILIRGPSGSITMHVQPTTNLGGSQSRY
jgi:hypothetical protein